MPSCALRMTASSISAYSNTSCAFSRRYAFLSPLSIFYKLEKSERLDEELKLLFEHYTSIVPPTSFEAPSGTAPPASPYSMSAEQFRSFLLSGDNSPFSEQNKGVWQDLTRPVSDYYISSSHNTYLVGHQLVGVSTVEGYIRALLHSCRSVESGSNPKI